VEDGSGSNHFNRFALKDPLYVENSRQDRNLIAPLVKFQTRAPLHSCLDDYQIEL